MVASYVRSKVRSSDVPADEPFEIVTMEPYSFAGSDALNIQVLVRIGSLEGFEKQLPFSTLFKNPELRFIGSNQSPHFDLYVTVELFADSKSLFVPVQTAYKAFKTSRTWNEWLTIPIEISSLPLTSQLAITIWDLSPIKGQEGAKAYHIPFGGTTISLFDSDGTLRQGRQKCYVHRHKAADGSATTTTPATLSSKARASGRYGAVDPDEDEAERLERLLKKHQMGEIPRIDWLDQQTYRSIERQSILARSSKPSSKGKDSEADGSDANGDDGDAEEGIRDGEVSKTKSSSASAEDGQFTLSIDFPMFEFPILFTDHEYPPTLPAHGTQAPNITLRPPPIPAGDPFNDPFGGRIVKIYDPEVFARDNPAESMHRRLVRSHRTNLLNRDLKPNAKIRDELNEIMSYSPTHELNSEEKDLVWKFRHHLTRDKRALTKFVKSVSWHDPGEARQAVQIIPKWTEIDIDDALELLGPGFDNPVIRAYAVERLRKADDEELLLYLLQLVQALKYEKFPKEATKDATQDSSLAKFLISRATQNLMLGNFFHWYLMVECDEAGPRQSGSYRKLFAKVEYDFMTELVKVPDGPARRNTLRRQGELITVLSKVSKEVRFLRGDRLQKIERLKQFLADPKNELTTFDPPLPLPLDPNVSVVSCIPEDSTVFKSTLFPLLVPFKTADGRTYRIIFKTGDDLRQDQLVIQIISLMDRLLQKENLDLKLSPYRILATGATAGAVEFVSSMSLAAASSKYKGSILAYLKANNPDENELLGVRKEAMETYIKSCAGYCVITYILGVGDRHLDNLLLAPDGHFFHADFGFILGRDPKPFAPAMKLCKEMVEGMGGSNSTYFTAFKQYCFTAYTTLRKSSNLILNLFSLMVDANIPDIRVEPDRAVWKVKERFHLELSEEEAIKHFETLINDSMNAIFPVVIDRIHGMIQNWRA